MHYNYSTKQRSKKNEKYYWNALRRWIKWLYEHQDFQSVQKYREEESVAYENLCKTLSPKQQEFLNEYEEKSSLRQAMENGKLYARGVKIGALLMLEIFNTDLGE